MANLWQPFVASQVSERGHGVSLLQVSPMRNSGEHLLLLQ